MAPQYKQCSVKKHLKKMSYYSMLLYERAIAESTRVSKRAISRGTSTTELPLVKNQYPPIQAPYALLKAKGVMQFFLE